MISLKTQKILSWIPILNVFFLFVWLYNCIRSGRSVPLMGTVLKVFAALVLVSILHGLLADAAAGTAFAALVKYGGSYLAAFAAARILIRQQPQ